MILIAEHNDDFTDSDLHLLLGSMTAEVREILF
jgi:transcription initiation factor IIE alpha subunit